MLLCIVVAHGLFLFGLGVLGYLVLVCCVSDCWFGVCVSSGFVCLCFVALWYGSRLITDCCKDCSLWLGLLVCCFTLFVLLGCIRTFVGCLLISICGLLL